MSQLGLKLGHQLGQSFEGAPYRLVRAAKSDVIFRQGDPASAVFRIDRGCVRLEIQDEHGRREIVAFLFPGDVFCVGLQQHWSSAYAVNDTLLARYPMSALWTTLARDPGAAMELLVCADQLVELVARHLALVCHATAGERLAWFLSWLHDRTGPEGSSVTQLPMSRRDIADFLGMAPETVSRLFRKLERRGDLRRTGHHSCILRSPSPVEL